MRWFLLPVFLFIAAMGYAIEPIVIDNTMNEKSLSFTGDWYFVPYELTDSSKINTEVETINLPFTVGSEYKKSIYSVWRKIIVSEDMLNKEIVLELNGLATAGTLYLNGEKIGSNGIPSGIAEEEVPGKLLYYCTLSFTQVENTLNIVISNHTSYSGGGVWSNFKAYLLENSLDSFDIVQFDTLFFGIIATIIFYYLILFLFRNKNYEILMFSLSSLMVLFRLCVTNAYLLERWFPLNIYQMHALQHLTILLAPIFFWLYFILLLKLDKRYYIIPLLGVVLSFTFFFGSIFFTSLLVVFQGYMFFCSVFAVFAMVKRRRENPVLLSFLVFGFTIFILTAIYDILVIFFTLTIFMTSYGFSVFVISQAFYLAYEMAATYKNEKRLLIQTKQRLVITEVYTRKSIVKMITEGIDPMTIKPKNSLVTIMFIDIRNFTRLSEGLEANIVVEILNAYFSKMNNVIIEYDGEIDKLIGDAIMAVFDDPDLAVASAIQMEKDIAELNSELKEKYKISIDVGLGLNFGEVVIGNIGSEIKLDYTVIGDAVNTASRIESLTRKYGSSILISEDLLNQLKSDYEYRFVDIVKVKGKDHPVNIYEIFDFEPDDIKLEKKNYQSKLKHAFDLYKSMEFYEAFKIYKNLRKEIGVVKHPETQCKDPIIDFYLKRCKELYHQKKSNSLDHWDGIYEFTTK